MGFLKSMDISASALTAQRLRMDVISENLANIDATRTAEGGPYRRKMVVFNSTGIENTYENSLFNKIFTSTYEEINARGVNRGVEVAEIVEDQEPFKMVYNPTHPDADENGYVAMPNVDSLKETVDMMEAFRAYQSNITALNSIKQMAMKALEIGR